MGRPAAGSPSARDRIVDVAGPLFYARGIHRVGIDEVIEKSGVARMTLYHHFASKQALVDAVLARRGVDRTLELDAVTSSSRDARRKVLAIFSFLRSSVRRPGYRGCAFINAAVDLADRDTASHALAATAKRELAERFEAIARAAGWRRPGRLALQLLLLWDGAAVEAYLQGSDEPVQAARAAADVLIAAAARPATSGL